MVKVYRRHNCAKNHRTFRTLAECIWPRAVWVKGEGQYACLSWCSSGPRPGPALTITLWDELREAEGAKEFIDDFGCGGKCAGPDKHEIIRLAHFDDRTAP